MLGHRDDASNDSELLDLATSSGISSPPRWWKNLGRGTADLSHAAVRQARCNRNSPGSARIGLHVRRRVGGRATIRSSCRAISSRDIIQGLIISNMLSILVFRWLGIVAERLPKMKTCDGWNAMSRIAYQLSLALLCSLLLSPATSFAQIRLGVSAPLTGPLATIGAQVAQGTKSAIERINSQNGIDGTKIEPVLADDGCRPEQAASVAQTLITRDKVVALIGFPCSTAALAAQAVAAQSNVLLIALASTPALTADRRNVLRMIGREDRLARMVGDYLAANFSGKRIGVWLTEQPTPFNVAFRAVLQARNVKPTRFDSSASAAFEPPPWKDDVDVLVVSPNTGPTTWRGPSQWRNRPTIVVPSQILTAELARLVRDDRNIVVITNPAPDFFEGGAALASETSGLFIYAYSAVQVFAVVAREARGNFSAAALVAAAQKAPVRTAVGPLRFDERGDIRNWQFAAYSAVSGPNVCKSPTCKEYDHCPPDCPK